MQLDTKMYDYEFGLEAIEPKSLETSIREQGQLYPLLVVNDQQHAVVCDGLRRAAVCQRLGITPAASVVTDDPKTGFMIRLNCLLGQPERLSPVVKARIIAQADNLEMPETQVLKKLQIPLNRIKLYKSIPGLPQLFLQRLHHQPEFLKLVDDMGRLMRPEQEHIAAVIDRFKLNANQGYEVLRIFLEMKLVKRDISADRWLDVTANSKQPAGEFLEWLRNQYQPKHYQQLQELRKELSGLERSEQIRFEYGDNFENDYLGVAVKIHDTEDVDTTIAYLQKNRQRIHTLLGMIQHEAPGR